MRSYFLDSQIITPEAALRDALNACLLSTTATVQNTNSDTFELKSDGFSKFIFAENPKNGVEKRLSIGGVVHDYCQLTATDTVLVARKTGFTPVDGDAVTVAEVSPFVYFGTQKQAAQLNQSMYPVCYVATPFAATAPDSLVGAAKSLRFTANIIVADLSSEASWGLDNINPESGYYPEGFDVYCTRPAVAFLLRVLDVLGKNFTVPSNNRCTLSIDQGGRAPLLDAVRNFGRDDLYKGFGLHAESSGAVLAVDLILTGGYNIWQWQRTL